MPNQIKLPNTSVSVVLSKYCISFFPAVYSDGIFFVNWHCQMSSRCYSIRNEAVWNVLISILSMFSKRGTHSVFFQASLLWRRVINEPRNHGNNVPDSKVHGAIMGLIRGRQDTGGPHVGPMNFAIWGLQRVGGLWRPGFFCVVSMCRRLFISWLNAAYGQPVNSLRPSDANVRQ